MAKPVIAAGVGNDNPVLTQERLHSLHCYDPDTGLFLRTTDRPPFKKGSIVGARGERGYIRILLDGRFYYAHRLAFLYVTGEMPEYVDHINGDKGDNRWHNLRPATATQNIINCGPRASNTSGYKGVTFHPPTGKWQARITQGGVSTSLGLYRTAAEAGAVRAKEEARRFGEYAWRADNDDNQATGSPATTSP